MTNNLHNAYMTFKFPLVIRINNNINLYPFFMGQLHLALNRRSVGQSMDY